jgi:hypothetical protein
MNDRTASPDAWNVATASRTALAPWLASLPRLQEWLGEHAASIWPVDGQRQASALLTLLRSTLDALALGREAIPPSSRISRAAASMHRIDTLLAGSEPARLAFAEAAARRKALLALALWNALRAAGSMASTRGETVHLSQLHRWLAASAPPAYGVSPAPAYAASDGAGRFFGGPVRTVLQALARKCDEQGAAYAAAIPAEPFDAGLPALAAWSHAWSIAVAGVYLDNLCRHAQDDLQRALQEVWSGRLDAVRFRAGAGLTALPAREGSLHLDLWTCAVKAQAFAFDTARWQAHAAGTRRHGLRIDMHDYAGGGSRDATGVDASRRMADGLGIEALYRIVFVDRLAAVLGDGASIGLPPSNAAAHAAEHTIAIEMDRPRDGHLPNLRLLLRWRDAPGEPMRLAADDSEPGALRRDTLRHWLASEGGEELAHALDPGVLDWRPADTASIGPDDDRREYVALGHCTPWRAVEPGAQWIDAAMVALVGGAWYELPVVLSDETQPDGIELRTWWLLRADGPLPPALDLATLRRALRSPAALQWVAHHAGLGAFVMAAVDVDAWRRAQAA